MPNNKKSGKCDDSLKSFKALDLFGQYVTFTHEREFTFNSIPGSIATVLFIVILIYFGAKRLPDLFSNKMTTLSEHEIHIDLDKDEIEIDLNKFKIAIGFTQELIPSIGKLFI